LLFTELKTQNNGLTLYHTTLLASSLQGADPWSNNQYTGGKSITCWTWDQWALDTVIGLLPGLLK